MQKLKQKEESVTKKPKITHRDRKNAIAMNTQIVNAMSPDRQTISDPLACLSASDLLTLALGKACIHILS